MMILSIIYILFLLIPISEHIGGLLISIIHFLSNHDGDTCGAVFIATAEYRCVCCLASRCATMTPAGMCDYNAKNSSICHILGQNTF